ncbi:MAG: Na/Pi cotransporter family protein [Clostridium butyricum]|nr:Na/Pi cotransporter family protein [Clostridium butyricum]
MDSLKMIIELLGGLGLFLYGMKLMGDGLENAAGEGLKSILERVTSNRIMGILVGAIVTGIIQSSSATTVMVVGFVNAGLMNLSQAFGVIMGANIGTTITAQLVAFKLDAIAPLFVFVGTIAIMIAKAKKRREIGNIILGFGILFTGMAAMGNAMSPLADSPFFTQVVIAIGDNWFIGIIAGLAFTALIQSSSATTGILIALASTGAINITLALPILFGCNIGTCITAILSSIGTNKTAHKTALLHLMFNFIGTVIAIPFLGILGDFVQITSPDISRQIANAHTVFNVVNTIILFPFSNYLISFANKMIPENDDDAIDKVGPKYMDNRFLETPVIAAGQVVKETIRMANKAKKNVELSMKSFVDNDEKAIQKVYENEKIINVLEESITAYLVKLSKCELSSKEKELASSTFHVIIDIERIGDHAKNIAELSTEKIDRNLKYSSNAINELYELYNLTMEALQIAITCYATKDIEKAKTILEVEEKINKLQKNFRQKHIQRLNDEKCTAYAGAIFLDLINNFERIGDHSTNITEAVISNYSN